MKNKKSGHFIINIGGRDSRKDLIDFLLKEGFTFDSYENIDEAYRVSFPLVVDINTMRFQYLTSTIHAAAAANTGFTKLEMFYKEYNKYKDNKPLYPDELTKASKLLSNA